MVGSSYPMPCDCRFHTGFYSYQPQTFFNALTINTCTSIFRHNFKIAVIHHSFTYRKRFCLFFIHCSIVLQRLFKIIKPDNRCPSLHIHYRYFITTMASSDASWHICRLHRNWVMIITDIGFAKLVFLLKEALITAFSTLSGKPLLFRIKACVMLLPSLCRLTCNQ